MEHVCDKCDGTGRQIIDEIKLYIKCQKCHGDGKVNWVEQILGKREVEINYCIDGVNEIQNISLLIEKLQDYCDSCGYYSRIDVYSKLDENASPLISK